MKAAISATLLRALPVPKQGHTDIRDTKVRGLVLRVRASGSHSYFLNFRRHRWFKLGDADKIPPHRARELASDAAILVAKGKDPQAEKRRSRSKTLRTFIEGDFARWAAEHQRHGGATVERLTAHFLGSWGHLPLTEIGLARVEQWRTGRLAAGVAPATLNRDTGTLKSALQRAVDWGILDANPLAKLKPLKTDRHSVARVLSAEEETRLRESLRVRDEERQAARCRANEWRCARGVEPYPQHGVFTDHLQPVVLLALITGLRRGELFALDWRDVDLEDAHLVVKGVNAKNSQSRVVPLCLEAVRIFSDLGPKAEGLVFPSSSTGDGLTTLKTAWGTLLHRADIKDLRFHDLRHTFASRLLAKGADAATVRDLLGHQALVVTARYAHSSHEQLRRAVATLDKVEG